MLQDQSNNYQEYHSMDKSMWETGPWTKEPDKVQWIDEETNLDCLIVRNYFGALCGYVGVSEGHFLYNVDYNRIDGIGVHGGLTFSEFCLESEEPSKGICHIPVSGRPEKVWWFGFDCGHCLDFMPYWTDKAHNDLVGRRIANNNTTYRDIDYVKEQCRYLAKQLKEAQTLSKSVLIRHEQDGG